LLRRTSGRIVQLAAPPPRRHAIHRSTWKRLKVEFLDE
jgi:hypothetical protein